MFQLYKTNKVVIRICCSCEDMGSYSPASCEFSDKLEEATGFRTLHFRYNEVPDTLLFTSYVNNYFKEATSPSIIYYSTGF